MAGVLEFALGLKTSEFLGELGASSREVLSFAAVMEGVKFGAEKMWGAIEQGAGLQEMAYRTNQTAQSLYGLQMGFKGVGLSAEAVPEMILKMQRGLSGVNEMGMKTDILFMRLGLTLQHLRTETAQQQIADMAGALNKLSTTDAAGIAGKIFGRGAAGDILQISHGLEEYQRVMSSTTNDASIFGVMAHAWGEIKGDAEIFESHINAVWAAIATGITPALHKMMDGINRALSNLATGLAGAIQFGGISTLLKDGLQAALEQAGYYGARVFSAVAAGFGSALVSGLMQVIPTLGKEIFNGLSTGINFALAELARGIIKVEMSVASAMGLSNSVGGKNLETKLAQVNEFENSLGQVQTKQNQDSIGNLVGSITQGAQEAFKSAMDDWKQTGGNDPHTALDKFNADLKNFSSQFKSAHANDVPVSDNKVADGPTLQNHYKPDFTSLEKMGFVMGGTGNPMKRSEDLLGQIVRNTAPENQPRFDSPEPPTNQV